jgi:hypothetical protein
MLDQAKASSASLLRLAAQGAGGYGGPGQPIPRRHTEAVCAVLAIYAASSAEIVYGELPLKNDIRVDKWYNTKENLQSFGLRSLVL